VPGVETAKSCKFTVDANLTGLPNPLQQMAHNEGNILSERHTAEFALENGAWKIHDVR
jgi:hypothetical protein